VRSNTVKWDGACEGTRERRFEGLQGKAEIMHTICLEASAISVGVGGLVHGQSWGGALFLLYLDLDAGPANKNSLEFLCSSKPEINRTETFYSH
jgi:hypothetical protein